jgi:hypothetical protein
MEAQMYSGVKKSLDETLGSKLVALDLEST